ncbi:hypothetical protein PPN31114_04722 [Pandoraea pneumonica]|jgi:hypothetical protein|uniref:DUF1640 domain-containing protein n=1 Tax=Pandoraea pneumonica TaxID=2508299 RepID=A0A5E4YRS5_9BURK|nr:DUF1640 domain-containing protein [Pandoraea pneumonica]VVE51499.1 hypothetical protein PPN31114_04722 [Pandoraea pneumonica]
MRLHERVTKIEAVLPTLATKEDLAREVGGLRSEMHLEFGKVRQEMGAEFSKMRKEVSAEFASVRKEMSELRVDVSELRVDVHRAIEVQTWRVIGTLITVCTALVAATYFITKAG